MKFHVEILGSTVHFGGNRFACKMHIKKRTTYNVLISKAIEKKVYLQTVKVVL